MMMENRENSLDRELIGHLQHVQFGGQHEFNKIHQWEDFGNERKDCVNGTDMRNKGPSPCNSQASLGYHSLPSSQCGSRPSSNPDYIVDYGTSTSSYEQSTTYLDSPLANSSDICWRHNTSSQSMDTSVREINKGHNNKESIRKSIDMEWRQWCHQQQQHLKQNAFTSGQSNGHQSNGHHRSGHHSNGIQIQVGMHPKRTTKQHNQFLHFNGIRQNDERWIPNGHHKPTHCELHHQRYEEPMRAVDMLSKSFNNQFRTCLPTEDPIYEEITEHNIIRCNEVDFEEIEGPNLPPRPKSWTSMVNLHQKSKAPVYYQIEPNVTNQHNGSCCKMQQDHGNRRKPSRGVCTNTPSSDLYNQNDVSSINLPYFPYINRLFQEDSDISESNNISKGNEKDIKMNEKKSGKIEKFFGSLLSLNKSKGVKNMGTSTDEKTKEESNVEKHRKLRRTVSESCNIYSRGKGNTPTYEDDMCNLLKEIQFNMKEIDHNSKKLNQNPKDKKIKNSEIKNDRHRERRNSRRDSKTSHKTCEDKSERTQNNKKLKSGTAPSPHHYPRNSSSDLRQSGSAHSVNQQAIKTVLTDSRSKVCNSTPENSHNKSQCSNSHRKSTSSRPAMGVQALLTRSSNYSSPETTLNRSTDTVEENNSVEVDDSFQRRLSHERVGSRLSFVYDYSEGSDSEDVNADMIALSGYVSESYAQGLASGEDNENWIDGDQVYGVTLAKPLFRNNVVAMAKRRKLIEKVTEL
ncbi:uncharacterized protein [Antedon mediterranea]|uniref:uncharacterized protein n=1 Tax=Antedon mediterranea TaxID=105859 RepID=UPI003AF9048A